MRGLILVTFAGKLFEDRIISEIIGELFEILQLKYFFEILFFVCYFFSVLFSRVKVSLLWNDKRVLDKINLSRQYHGQEYF